MAEPKSWQVLEAVAAAVAGMTGVRPWGGSYPADPIVQHHYEAPRPVAAFLRLRVREGTGSTVEIKHINQAQNVMHRFNVLVEATLTGNLELPAQGWLQRVRDDLLTTLLGAMSCGGLCSGFGDVLTLDAGEPEAEAETDAQFPQQVTLVVALQYWFHESKALA